MLGVQLRRFSPSCAVHNRGFWPGAGSCPCSCCSSVPVAQARCPGFDSGGCQPFSIGEMSTFTHTLEKYELLMPFRLTNAPAVFQRLMQCVLMGLNPEEGPDFVAAYIDDILIFSRTLEDHIDHLRLVFERLVKTGLKLNVAGEVTRRRLRKHKPGLQSGPVLLLVSGLGFGLGQSCVA